MMRAFFYQVIELVSKLLFQNWLLVTRFWLLAKRQGPDASSQSLTTTLLIKLRTVIIYETKYYIFLRAIAAQLCSSACQTTSKCSPA